MHIRKRSMLLALPLAAAGLGIGAVPVLAAHAAHARPAIAGPVTPSPNTVLIDIFTSKQQVPTPRAGVYTTTMVPYTWGINAGVTTTVKVVSYDSNAHNIVAPQLNLNVTIKAGKIIKKSFKGETATERINGVMPSFTTFTVTGTTQGAYAWQSTTPASDSSDWGMSGYIVVN